MVGVDPQMVLNTAAMTVTELAGATMSLVQRATETATYMNPEADGAQTRRYNSGLDA